MSVLDRIQGIASAVGSSVSSAGKQVSHVVSGAVGSVWNPVFREYELGQHVASFGPGLIWKIYEGKKRSTGQEVSVFVMEKKSLEKMEKRDREIVLPAMKKGPTQLTRLRHPRMLMIQHPTEESRDSIAFATEPVFASLANLLGNHENMPSPLPKEFKEFELYDVEKVYGLYQVVEGLIFLHNDAKILEGNLTPESIIVTKSGQWKIAGFHYCATSTPDAPGTFPGREWESRLHPFAQPDLNYCAPEYALSRSSDYSADMYSLGVIFYAVYNNGKPPLNNENSLATFKRHVEQMSRSMSIPLGSVPEEARETVRLLLSVTTSLRPDAHQISKIKYFDNVAAMTLQYMDNLVQQDDMTKSQFFKNLYKVMSKLPKRVVHQRVLPNLFAEFPNHMMIPFVLPNVLLVAQDCTDEEYNKIIFPNIKPAFSVKDPVQVLLIFMQKMDLLLKKTSKEDVKNYVLPMVFRALETPSEEIQDITLNIIPTFAAMVEYAAMKHSIVPRIKTLILQSTTLSIRVKALVCLGSILEHLDKSLIIDDIFPMMKEIPGREPAVLMAILGLYKQTMIHKKLGLDKNYIASKAIPFLFPLAVDPGLNLKQFNQYMSVLNEMTKKVESEHRLSLEQLSKMKEQTKTTLQFAQEAQDAKANEELMSRIDTLFSTGEKDSTFAALPSPKKSPSDSKPAIIGTRSEEFNKLMGLTSQEKKTSSSVTSLSADLLGSKDGSVDVLKPNLTNGTKNIQPKPSLSQMNTKPKQSSPKPTYKNSMSSSLIESNLNSLKQSNITPSPSMTQTAPNYMPFNTTTTTTSMPSYNNFSTMNTMSSNPVSMSQFPGQSFGAMSAPGAGLYSNQSRTGQMPQQKPAMSVFDNIQDPQLAGMQSQKRVPLNQMKPQNIGQPLSSQGWNMGSTGMTSQPGMMGTGMYGGGGMMGQNMPRPPVMGQTLQPQMATPQQNTSVTSNDLKDIFG